LIRVASHRGEPGELDAAHAYADTAVVGERQNPLEAQDALQRLRAEADGSREVAAELAR
jgi:hypothetical protein